MSELSESHDTEAASTNFPDFGAWSMRDLSFKPDAGSAQLFQDARAGRGPQNFADDAISCGLAAELGVDRAYLERFGADLFKALAVRGSHRKVRVTLQRLIRQLVRDLSRGKNPKADEYFLHYTCSIQAELARREFSGEGRLPRIFGVVIGAIEQLHKRGIPVTFEKVCKVTRDFENASVTDTKNAILAHTSDVNLKLGDWLAPRDNAERAA